MPASVAHMLLFEDVVANIEDDGDCDDFVTMLKGHMSYGRLGSVGPDLPYYASIVSTVYALLITGSDKPAGLEKWSGQLHSKEPNVFPLKMIEIAWRETDLDAEEWDAIAKRQWAFITGFLTHMAADQSIHPFVNTIAGQYYRSKESRIKHGECEAYQDVVLFTTRYNRSILSENLADWVDVSAGAQKTDPFFRTFLQKSFLEAHAQYPSAKEIDRWAGGLSTAYTVMGWFGPYVDADRDFRSNGENSLKYKEFWLNNGSPGNRTYEDYYNDAIELASIYAKTAYQLFNINHADFEDAHRKRFLEIVKNADLTNPLDNNILKEARETYKKYFPT